MSEHIADNEAGVSERVDKSQKVIELAHLVLRVCVEGEERRTDEELEQITASSEVEELLREASYHGISCCKRELRYRKRRRELEDLSTDELRSKYESINRERSAAIAADFSDNLPDSFYELPSKDSDSHILHELLTEREGR